MFNGVVWVLVLYSIYLCIMFNVLCLMYYLIDYYIIYYNSIINNFHYPS